MELVHLDGTDLVQKKFDFGLGCDRVNELFECLVVQGVPDGLDARGQSYLHD